MKSARGILVILILTVAFFYTVNVFSDPSVGSNAVLENSETEEIEEQIIIPLKAHIIVDRSGVYTSSRSEENIISLLEKANQIWAQANIYFQLEEIVVTNVSFEAIPNTINGNNLELSNHKTFAKDKINLFLVQNLNNINGLAVKNIDSILVSDYTTVNDFRTTAHELGHLLGLNHVAPPNRLMARGKNGEILTKEEVLIARENSRKTINKK